MLLKTEPLNEHFGAEILGVDLRDAMTPEIEQTIKKLFLTHQLLYFRGQDLSPDNHVRFGKIFGELQIHVMNQYHESEHPERYRLSNIGEDGKPIYREDGKVMKGPNYQPPKLDDLFNE